METKRNTKRKTQQFMIEPWEAESMMKEEGLTDIADLLPLLVPAAQRLARPPISNFPVGAVGVGSTGRIYLGCNLEFPGLPLHHSVHAEQFLLANASLHSEPLLLSLAVSAAPCGHCRQFLQELRHSHTIRILVISDPQPLYRPLLDFLPRPFGPLDLLDSNTPFLLENTTHIDDDADDHDNNNNHDAVDDVERLVKEAAGEAARRAHAPYSGCRSGFAVADGKGRVYRGWYMESAAYNPSLGPVQAAMVGYLVGGGEEWEGIMGGALAEGEAAAVSQEGTARIFFEKVAPKAKIWVHRLGDL